jgi:hypothetical protein
VAHRAIAARGWAVDGAWPQEEQGGVDRCLTERRRTNGPVESTGFVIMKIEIAESLVLSWLRHVQGCAVTQLNWKPSPKWPLANEQALRHAFERIRTLAGETIGVPIFTQGEFAQFVRQTEIDVLGIRLPHDTANPQAIAVDSAFHEGGLNYGSADETVGRVLK